MSAHAEFGSNHGINGLVMSGAAGWVWMNRRLGFGCIILLLPLVRQHRDLVADTLSRKQLHPRLSPDLRTALAASDARFRAR